MSDIFWAKWISINLLIFMIWTGLYFYRIKFVSTRDQE